MVRLDLEHCDRSTTTTRPSSSRAQKRMVFQLFRVENSAPKAQYTYDAIITAQTAIMRCCTIENILCDYMRGGCALVRSWVTSTDYSFIAANRHTTIIDCHE